MRPVTGTPALTMREIRLEAADKGSGRHWSHACWCEVRHEGNDGGLTLVPPPWDVTRDGEKAV